VVTIALKDQHGAHLISVEAGANLGKAMFADLEAGRTVTLDANDVTVICSSFLVGLLGTVYGALPTEHVRKHITLTNASDLMQQTFELVCSHMERYVTDPKYREACEQFAAEVNAA